MKKPQYAKVRFGKLEQGWRERAYTIIFEAHTVAGRRFDTMLLVLILLSVLVVMVDSIEAVRTRDFLLLNALEWLFTVLFTIEYVVRLWCIQRRWRYALSWFGIIDLVSILPTYLAFFFPEFHYLID